MNLVTGMATPKCEHIKNISNYGQLRDKPKDAPNRKMIAHIGSVTSASVRKLIHHMLDKAEDYLFTQAEFAENDSIQTLYNDAMREMHVIRDAIETDFLTTFQHQILHGLARTKLIDDFDERPAITTIVDRVRRECAHTLNSLDNQFGILLRDPGLETLHNPLGPEALCEALRIATKHIETGIEIRLVVFKLFDQHVAIRLNEIYTQIDQLMANNTAGNTITTSTHCKMIPEKLSSRSEKITQGKQRLDEAKSMSNEVIVACIRKEISVDFVRDFISDQWKNLLFVICARHGKNSTEWNRAVATMDDLIWSIKTKHSSEDRVCLMKLQPRLLANLREGMESLSVPVTTRDEFLTRLIQLHNQLTATQKEEVAPAIKSTDTLRKLKIGAWVNFNHDGGVSTRAKLSWISPITGMYLFTDSAGQKYASFTTEQMSELVRLGKAIKLTAAPMVNSAIRNVARV